ncbi:MAG: hypothetical protein IJ150_13065 [Bacteroidales bacterium]|nr:hypothetical protein [Bacteroidales bacterium]
MKKHFFILTILACLLVFGCATPIGTITKHGERFNGKNVVVKGKVINTLHLEDLNYFVLKKKKNYINIITNDFLPAVNDNVKVKGKVISKFYYQRDTILVVKETITPAKKTSFNKAVN